MDFTNWPIWALLALLLLTNQHTIGLLKKFLSVFGIAISGSQQAESDERQWQRGREDKMFGVIQSIIENGQEESKKDRQQLADLAGELSKNTNALSRQTDVLERQSDMIRLLAYNAATVDEKLERIHHHIETRHFDEKDD